MAMVMLVMVIVLVIVIIVPEALRQVDSVHQHSRQTLQQLSVFHRLYALQGKHKSS
jgi:competence protein ComGC